MSTLTKLIARQVLDSRGRPTVEVEATSSDGAVGRAIVPSGASTGRHEALELRDHDPSSYEGLSVYKAVGHVETEIAHALHNFDLDDQEGIDATLIKLDGTANKSRLGANAILGVSLAVAYAAAASHREELYVYIHRLWREKLGTGETSVPTMPMPMVNMISGGLHAGGNLDFQDFLMIPIGATSYTHALDMTCAVYRSLARVLGDEARLVGDEGGFGPRLGSNQEAVERVIDAIAALGLVPGRDVAIALDVASTHFYDTDQRIYRLKSEAGKTLDAAGMVDLLEDWTERYPIVSIEDGLAEDDWQGWTELTARLGNTTQLIGDDLFATQVPRLQRGISAGAGNAVLIKVNQVGTLTETLDTLLLARRNGYRTVVSARSGETEDATIADLAVATGAGQIKIGSVARSERLAKYNRLLRIEGQLGAQARFAGWADPRNARL